MNVNQSSVVINRRNNSRNKTNTSSNEESRSDDDVTLSDKLLILSLQNGRTPYLNEHLSICLRGCLLIDLEMFGMIQLEPPTLLNPSILTRCIVVKNAEEESADPILNEVLQHLKTDRASVGVWMERLNGESWFPSAWKYQMRNVRTRLAKSLVDKGVLSVKKQHYFIFEEVLYPLRDYKIKCDIFKVIQNALLDEWEGRPLDLNISTLSLIMLTYAADLMNDVLNVLRLSERNLAKKRLYKIVNNNFVKEAAERQQNEIAWAVFALLFR